MQIIGLTGVARAGKDTVGKILADASSPDRTVKVTGFAHQLKLSAARCFSPAATLDEALEWADALKVDGQVVLEDVAEGERGGVTGREFLQNYGTEAHRDVFGQNFWLDAVLPDGRDDCDLLVITDVRFENEAHRIRACGGEVWEVVRPGVEAVNAHASDAGFDYRLINRVVRNDGTIEDLRAQIESIW